MTGYGVGIGCVVRWLRIDRRHWGSHQLLGARDVDFAAGAGQQPVVADAVSAITVSPTVADHRPYALKLLDENGR